MPQNSESSINDNTYLRSEDDDEEEEEGEEEEEEGLLDDASELDDDDDEDEAEAIAKRLGDQLWADINKAHADRARSTTSQSAPHNPMNEQISKKVEAVITTIKAVLSFAESDALVESTLSKTLIPGTKGDNVLSVLRSIATSGTLTRDIAGPLSHAIVALAKSDELFSPLPTISPHIQNSKRRRDDLEHEADVRPYKKTVNPHLVLESRLVNATEDIKAALALGSDKLDPTIISSIQLQLHQVFLFAVTSATVVIDDQIASALQEITGLIQILGILSGIQITANVPTADGISVSTSNLGSSVSQAKDIGTAVYPCLSTGCQKTFSRLYSLRQHQRVHSIYRPFKCDKCVASFVRNHDLRRHLKSHGKCAFKCSGCDRIFSRRDAIKRHRDNTKKGGECVAAVVEEVDIGSTTWNQTVRENRRNKLWDEITSASATAAGPVGDDGLEEGELTSETMTKAQEVVINLRSLLQNKVTSALGAATATSFSSLASAVSQADEMVDNSPPMASLALPISAPVPTASSLPDYGLNEDQAKLLELAIANATAAAQAQAETEAMLEEEEDFEDQVDGDEDDDDDDDDEGTAQGADDDIT